MQCGGEAGKISQDASSYTTLEFVKYYYLYSSIKQNVFQQKMQIINNKLKEKKTREQIIY